MLRSGVLSSKHFLIGANKCELTINAEVSSVTVGDNGNIDSFLSSLSYEVEEAELALAY